MKQKTRNKENGFTIIELMVAMTIFIVIVTIGIGAVLNALSQHKSSEAIRTIMDNLNFTMEDMARNIRLGTNMDCVASGGIPTAYSADTDPVVPHSCPHPNASGEAHNIIHFNNLQGQHLSYIISASSPSQVFKQVGDSGPPELITPPEVALDINTSGFTVRGAEISPTDQSQPSVVIRLAGTIKTGTVTSKFAIQTTVTLRGLDI